MTLQKAEHHRDTHEGNYKSAQEELSNSEKSWKIFAIDSVKQQWGIADQYSVRGKPKASAGSWLSLEKALKDLEALKAIEEAAIDLSKWTSQASSRRQPHLPRMRCQIWRELLNSVESITSMTLGLNRAESDSEALRSKNNMLSIEARI